MTTVYVDIPYNVIFSNNGFKVNMDYQFRNDLYGQPEAKFSMDHEAIGHWITEELSNDPLKTNQLLRTILKVEQAEIGFEEMKGVRFLLTINPMEIEIEPLGFERDDDELNDGQHLYEDELRAECGLTDFKQIIIDWLDFIS